MRKKKYLAILLFTTFILVFHSKNAVASQDTLLIHITSENAVVYDNQTKTLVKVGELLKGEVYRAKIYGQNWYEIIFAGKAGFVPKKDVTEVTGVNLRNAKTTEESTGDMIKTKGELTVYDNSTSSLIPFAKIVTNIQYPILGIYGNWYEIEVAGRIGYVYKTNTEFHPKPVSKPPMIKGNKIEVVQDHTEIYDNRTGQLIKVGELIKGQVIKIIRNYGDNWVEVQFSDRTGYIHRSKIKESSASMINENKYYMPLGDMVQIINNTTVYDNSSGKLIPIGTITKNTKYPILSNYGNWYRIEVAGRIGFIHKNSTIPLNQKFRTSNTAKVPVLMYHHLLQKKENAFLNNSVILNLENFKEQLNYLSKNGFQTVSLADVEAYIKGDIKLRDKTVAITFDDGHKTNHLYALPLLKQYGYQAGAFIITSRITNYPSTFNPYGLQSLSVPELYEMKSNFQIGSHTANLHQLSKNKSHVLTREPSVVLNDFMISKKYLNTTYFCYPFGQYTKETIQLLKKAGYSSAYTTKTGYANVRTNPYEIPRFGVYPNTSLKEFANIVYGNKK